jgi:hypothetical protein
MKISKSNNYSTDMCQRCQVSIVCVKEKKKGYQPAAIIKMKQTYTENCHVIFTLQDKRQQKSQENKSAPITKYLKMMQI